MDILIYLIYRIFANHCTSLAKKIKVKVYANQNIGFCVRNTSSATTDTWLLYNESVAISIVFSS